MVNDMKKKIMVIAIAGIIACEIADMIEIKYKKRALLLAKHEIDELEEEIALLKRKKQIQNKRHFRR